MDAQLKKGMLDGCVLAILNRKDSYGYELTQDAKKILDVSESSLYPILRRLEASGQMTTYDVPYNGRLRRYYKLTDAGRKRLLDFKEELKDTKKVIDFIMEEDQK
ncbi:MAG: PadR family transcriptional regulator [Clostridia bacterium]|jgi:PadR family transcriptional regulator PadR